ncbi:MAG TPA: SRPBCC domain-containing protein [Solirubrobacterales bacterium]|nr:SRPBCC domain-containing protein [Solirubrobacterales bacterium]
MDEMTREVELECEPERAWRALTEESELSEWLGGQVEADLTPGGEIVVRDDGGERSGFFETIEPGRELSFWWARDEEESTRVEFELLPATEGDGCVVRVTESRPLVALETELAEISSSGPGPVANAQLARV